MPTLEFFYDVGSPWTYLAFHEIEKVAAEGRAQLVWKPILVGGVFNAVNPGVYAARANPTKARSAYMAKDLADWARRAGLRILWPPSVFPVNSVAVMRGVLAAFDAGRGVEFSRAAFEAYWGEDRDISREEVLSDLAAAVGLDAKELLARIATPELKQRLRANTDELVARGGFGSPTIFVAGDDLYFGNDRLCLVREALARHRAASDEGSRWTPRSPS
jgi:2-hydroxychromene-2-carboxylate isomerase